MLDLCLKLRSVIFVVSKLWRLYYKASAFLKMYQCVSQKFATTKWRDCISEENFYHSVFPLAVSSVILIRSSSGRKCKKPQGSGWYSRHNERIYRNSRSNSKRYSKAGTVSKNFKGTFQWRFIRESRSGSFHTRQHTVQSKCWSPKSTARTLWGSIGPGAEVHEAFEGRRQKTFLPTTSITQKMTSNRLRHQ